MQMSDAEIVRRMRQAKTKAEKNRQIRVMAELNAVELPVMREYVNALTGIAVASKAPQGKNLAAGGKKRGPKPKKAAQVVVEAVKLRLEEVGNLIEVKQRQIQELAEENKAYLEEWGTLTEFVKANE